MAADETKIRGAMYTARQFDQSAPLDMVEMLAELENDRNQLEFADIRVIRQIGAKYADRLGYRDEWRPVVP